jgi:hypothetical protein
MTDDNDESPWWKLTVGEVLLAVALIGCVLAVLLTSLGCRPPKDGTTWSGKAISCATDSVRHNWGRIYPEVQNCLVSIAVEPVACLDAIPAALQVGIETVACIVRGSGEEAAAQSRANPRDFASARKADRAEQYLQAKGFTFAE